MNCAQCGAPDPSDGDDGDPAPTICKDCFTKAMRTIGERISTRLTVGDDDLDSICSALYSWLTSEAAMRREYAWRMVGAVRIAASMGLSWEEVSAL